MMITGISVTGAIYVLIGLCSVAMVPVGEPANMLKASRLLYGMARQAVLRPFLGRVHLGRRTACAAILFTTALSLAVGHRVKRAPDSASSSRRTLRWQRDSSSQ